MTNGVKSWSYSAWSTYNQCPLKFKLEKIDKIKTPTPPAFIKGREWHKKAEDFLLGRIDIVPELKNFKDQFQELRTLDPIVEDKWGFKRDWSKTDFKDWNGCWFRAVVDAGVVYADDTLDLIDHKTGRKYGENEDQIELFSLAGMMRFPTVTHVTARLWYLETGDEVIAEYDAKDREKLQLKWEKRVYPMFNDTRFAPRPNDKCGWCHFRNSNGGPCQYG